MIDITLNWVIQKIANLIHTKHSNTSNFIIAFVMVAVALLIRFIIAPINGGLQYVTFFPAVALSAVIGGIWPGIFASTICLLLATFIFTAPYYSFSTQSLVTSFWPNVVFFFDGIVVCLSIEAMHRYNGQYKEELNKVKIQSEITEKLSRKYLKLMESSLSGIHILDIAGNLLEANDSFCKMLGYTQDELIGAHITLWAKELTREELVASLRSRLGNNVKFETLHQRKDGTKINVEICAVGVLIDGQTLIFASSTDITASTLANEKLLASEANMCAMLDNLPYLAWLKNIEGQYIAVNKTFANFFKLNDILDIKGKTDFDFFPQKDATKYRDDDIQVIKSRQQSLIEEKAEYDNEVHWVETFKTPIIDTKNRVLGTVGIARDITERKEFENKLKDEKFAEKMRAEAMELQFGHLLRESFNEIYLIDASSLKFLQTSTGAQKNLGYTEVELAELTPIDLKPDYSRETFELLVTPIREKKLATLVFSTNHKRKDGTLYPVEVRLQYMEAPNPVFLAIIQDITERETAAQESRKLAKHIQTIREDEMAHLAREIHDDLGGTLAGLKMDAFWLMEKLEANDNQQVLYNIAKSMVNQLDKTVASARNIITELRPLILDDLGLTEAMRWKCNEFQIRTGIECVFFCKGDDENFKYDLEGNLVINLYRITQEALNNISKHSGATNVEVHLDYDAKEIHLAISDNGCGILDINNISKNAFGLRGIRERIDLLNGRIEFVNNKSGGFCVSAHLPREPRNKIL